LRRVEHGNIRGFLGRQSPIPFLLRWSAQENPRILEICGFRKTKRIVDVGLRSDLQAQKFFRFCDF
jgi:hypothetical protein